MAAITEFARLERVVKTLALTIGLLTALAVPSGFGVVGYFGQIELRRFQARIGAERVAQYAYVQGRSWRYSDHRVAELIASSMLPGDSAHHVVTDARGGVVVAVGEVQPEPVLRVRAPIMAATEHVGEITVETSLRPLIYWSGLLALLGVGLGLLVFACVHVLPLRALRRALRSLDATHEDLRDQAVKTKAALEVARSAEGELRQAHQMLKAIVDASPAAIIALDPDQRIIAWNKAGERIFGYASDEVIGQQHSVVPAEHRAEFERQFAHVMAGQTLSEVQLQRRRKDGGMVTVQESGAPLFGPDGTVRGVMYVVEDITERLRLEDQLRQAQKMEAIGNLTGGMAHDFNNILGVVVGNIEMLQGQIGQGTLARELADEALEAAMHGAELIQRLLAFARRQRLDARRIEVNDLVENTTKLLRRTLGEDVEVKLVLDDGAWPVVADPSQLESALANLANNARDAMPSGGRLTICTCNVTLDDTHPMVASGMPPGDYAVIEVSDTGQGMPPEVLSRVFEPFFTTKEPGRGTGLGLAMVFGFVKQSSGQVSIYSEIGRGTTVRIYLPRNLDDAPERDEITADGLPQARAEETVLAVEDNDRLRAVVSRQLAALGYRVLLARDGQDALDLLAGDQRIDLLLTDIVMPGGLDGYALLRRAAGLRPGLRGMLTSGFAEAALRAPNQSETWEILSKPYRSQDLAEKVRRALDGGVIGTVLGAAGQ